MIERGLWEWRETEMAKEERSEVTLLFWLLGSFGLFLGLSNLRED
jgi:hypothetical protein